MPTGVFADANVLFPLTTRAWLFLLRNETCAGMFTVHASEDVIAEVIYRLRRRYPRMTGGQITSAHDRISQQLDQRVTDYEPDPDNNPVTDPDDAHIHAAALASGAGILLTADSGFTKLDEAARNALPYEIYTPDDFFTLVDDGHPAAVRNVTHQQMTYFYNKNGEVDLGQALRASGCPTFARRVAVHCHSWPHPQA